MYTDIRLNLKNILIDICDNLKAHNYVNEESVRVGIVIRILEALEQPIFNPKLVCYEYSVNKLNSNGRLDVAIFSQSDADLADIYIEVKAVGKLNIQEGENQLYNYTFQKNTKIAILTDGNTWIFYLPRKQLENGIFSKCKFLKFDLVDFRFSIEEKADFFEKFLSQKYYENDEVIHTAEYLFEKEQFRNILLDYCCSDNMKQAIKIMPKEAIYLCLQKHCEENNIPSETERFKNDINLFIENINNEIEYHEKELLLQETAQIIQQQTKSQLPILSIKTLDPIINHNRHKKMLPTDTVLYLTKRNELLATGKQNTDKTFTVFKDSIGLPFTKNFIDANPTMVELRNYLLQHGYVVNISHERIMFIMNYTFSKSSTAAGIILGRSSNGNKEWHE